LTDIWPVANIRLTTDTDILKFAYRYICQYFNKVFWLKLPNWCGLLTALTYDSLTNEVN